MRLVFVAVTVWAKDIADKIERAVDARGGEDRWSKYNSRSSGRVWAWFEEEQASVHLRNESNAFLYTRSVEGAMEERSRLVKGFVCTAGYNWGENGASMWDIRDGRCVGSTRGSRGKTQIQYLWARSKHNTCLVGKSRESVGARGPPYRVWERVGVDGVGQGVKLQWKHLQRLHW